ncbi:hypothetical protein [Paralcaligenes ureilyticus]|uniref:Secreted protein n=1 Tax=Paralcaligenes ureilyticus TaxID=627131 RepID=A0A4V2UY79_9BURK|nr:hypothetical protein [Paralcaligenes ureilyticus]TCT06388.1 hypothetical protein EDC26_108124 [Paralcaligenes ureilyticus]
MRSMKNSAFSLLKSLLLCLALCSTPVAPAGAATTTVHSLDQVRGATKSTEGRAVFDQQMNGAPQPDGFGTHLPDGFTKEWLAAQLAPGQDIKRLTLAGAKPWPQQPNKFVAVVCLARSVKQAASELKGVTSSCAGFNDPDHDVWFGVFGRDAGGSPKLVARTEAAVDVPVRWNDTDLEVPQSVGSDASGGNSASGMPESWLRFDLAPYQLHAGDPAFGVRVGWSEGYSGGGASYEALYLFQIDGAKLRVVFAQPMMFTKDLAGDWHKDGTRDHEVSEGSNVLAVLARTSDGFHDLRLRERRGKWSRTFRWSAPEQRYIVVK